MVLKLERGRAALAPFPTCKYSDLEAESMMSELGKNLAQKTRSWRFVSQRKFRSHRPTALHSGPQIPVVRKTFADRKSTRLNSSHGYISYAVFCLKKKKHKVHLISLVSRARYE